MVLCSDCGSSNVNLNDHGQYVCNQCGTIQEGMMEEHQDEEDLIQLMGAGIRKTLQIGSQHFSQGDGAISSAVLNSQLSYTQNSTHVDSSIPQLQNDADGDGEWEINVEQKNTSKITFLGFIKAMQDILRSLANQLVTQWGITPFLEVEIRSIWFEFLRKTHSSGIILKSDLSGRGLIDLRDVELSMSFNVPIFPENVDLNYVIRSEITEETSHWNDFMSMSSTPAINAKDTIFSPNIEHTPLLKNSLDLGNGTTMKSSSTRDAVPGNMTNLISRVHEVLQVMGLDRVAYAERVCNTIQEEQTMKEILLRRSLFNQKRDILNRGRKGLNSSMKSIKGTKKTFKGNEAHGINARSASEPPKGKGETHHAGGRRQGETELEFLMRKQKRSQNATWVVARAETDGASSDEDGYMGECSMNIAKQILSIAGIRQTTTTASSQSFVRRREHSAHDLDLNSKRPKMVESDNIESNYQLVEVSVPPSLPSLRTVSVPVSQLPSLASAPELLKARSLRPHVNRRRALLFGKGGRLSFKLLSIALVSRRVAPWRRLEAPEQFAGGRDGLGRRWDEDEEEGRRETRQLDSESMIVQDEANSSLYVREADLIAGWPLALSVDLLYEHDFVCAVLSGVSSLPHVQKALLSGLDKVGTCLKESYLPNVSTQTRKFDETNNNTLNEDSCFPFGWQNDAESLDWVDSLQIPSILKNGLKTHLMLNNNSMDGNYRTAKMHAIMQEVESMNEPSSFSQQPISETPSEIAQFGIRDRVIKLAAPKSMVRDYKSLSINSQVNSKKRNTGIRSSLRGAVIRLMFEAITSYIKSPLLLHALALVPSTPNKSSKTITTTTTSKSGDSRSTERKRLGEVPSLDLVLLLALLFIALRRLRIPVLPADICRWVLESKLDLANTLHAAPLWMRGVPSQASASQVHVTAALATFKRFLKPSSIESIVGRLVVQSVIEPGPPLRTISLLPRLLHAVYLPPKIQPIVCELLQTVETWLVSLRSHSKHSKQAGALRNTTSSDDDNRKMKSKEDYDEDETAIVDLLELALRPALGGVRIFGMMGRNKKEIILSNRKDDEASNYDDNDDDDLIEGVEEVHIHDSDSSADTNDIIINSNKDSTTRTRKSRKKDRHQSKHMRMKRKMEMLEVERDRLIEEENKIAYIHRGRLFVLHPPSLDQSSSSYSKTSTIDLNDSQLSAAERSKAYLSQQLASLLQLSVFIKRGSLLAIGRGAWRQVPTSIEAAALVLIGCMITWEGFGASLMDDMTKPVDKIDPNENLMNILLTTIDEALNAGKKASKNPENSTLEFLNTSQQNLFSSLPSSSELMMHSMALLETGGLEGRLSSALHGDSLMNPSHWRRLSPLQQEFALKSLWVQSVAGQVTMESKDTEIFTLFLRVLAEGQDKGKDEGKIEAFVLETLARKGIHLMLPVNEDDDDDDDDDDDIEFSNVDNRDSLNIPTFNPVKISSSQFISFESKAAQLEWFLRTYNSTIKLQIAYQLKSSPLYSNIHKKKNQNNPMDTSEMDFLTQTYPLGINNFNATHTLPTSRAAPLPSLPMAQMGMNASRTSHQLNNKNPISPLKALANPSEKPISPMYSFFLLQLAGVVGAAPDTIHKAVIMYANLLSVLWMGDKCANRYFEEKIKGLAALLVEGGGKSLGE